MTQAAVAAKKPVNLSINADLLRQAKELRINVSQVLETALASQVKRLREEQWLAENKEAIESYNRHVGENGLFTEGLRKRAWQALATPAEANEPAATWQAGVA